MVLHHNQFLCLFVWFLGYNHPRLIEAIKDPRNMVSFQLVQHVTCSIATLRSFPTQFLGELGEPARAGYGTTRKLDWYHDRNTAKRGPCWSDRRADDDVWSLW